MSLLNVRDRDCESSASPHACLRVGNILPDSSAAPALQGQQKELEKNMRADSLEHKIQMRPKAEELVKEGILRADENPTE